MQGRWNIAKPLGHALADLGKQARASRLEMRSSLVVRTRMLETNPRTEMEASVVMALSNILKDVPFQSKAVPFLEAPSPGCSSGATGLGFGVGSGAEPLRCLLQETLERGGAIGVEAGNAMRAARRDGRWRRTGLNILQRRAPALAELWSHRRSTVWRQSRRDVQQKPIGRAVNMAGVQDDAAMGETRAPSRRRARDREAQRRAIIRAASTV